MDEQFLENMKKWLELPRVSVVNPKQAKLLLRTVKELEAITPEEKLNATVKASTMALPSGNIAVTVMADEFIVHDLTRLAIILSRMKNMEVYTLENGKLCFAAIFPDVFIMKIIED